MDSPVTTVTIGGIDFDCPEMNFAALEMSWPFIEEAIFAANPVAGPSAGISILVTTWMETEGFNIEDSKWDKIREIHKVDSTSTYRQIFDAMVLYLKRSLKAKEVNKLREAINLILIQAEVVKDPSAEEHSPGEAKGAAPLTETSMKSSPNSLQPVAKEAAGTA